MSSRATARDTHASVAAAWIHSGDVLHLVAADGSPVTARCTEVEQRNWSRVTRADPQPPYPAGTLFVKQFVSARGDLSRTGCERERIAQLVAAAHGLPATVPQASDEGAAVLAYPFVPMDGMEHRYVADPQGFPELLCAVTDELRRALGVGGIPASGAVINFKGLEVRNVGVRHDGSVVLFDLGYAYFGTPAQAAARFLVSLALLNWGRDVRRVRLGPPEEVVRAGMTLFGATTNVASIEAELSEQYAVRQRKAQGRLPMRTAKRAGGVILGRRYFEQARTLLRRCAADVRH